MTHWIHTVKIKHLFTESENLVDICKAMNGIADVIDKDSFFDSFKYKKKFRNIPRGDEIITPLEYANNLLGKLYDYADDNRIWID